MAEDRWDADRDDLRKAIVDLLVVVAGPGCVIEVGYDRWERGDRCEHRFYVRPQTRWRGVVIGRDGKNVHALRVLVRQRAAVISSHDKVDVEVIDHRKQVDPSVSWFVEPTP